MIWYSPGRRESSMIIFNLLLKRRDGQYFVALATISENVVMATISENVVMAPHPENSSWHKIIAPRPAPVHLLLVGVLRVRLATVT